MKYFASLVLQAKTIPVRLCYGTGFRIKSHLTAVERATLYRLAANTKGEVFGEIGSYLGASAFFLAAGAKKGCTATKIICIDTWQNNAMSEGKRNTYEDFITNTAPFAEYIKPIKGFSHEVVSQVNYLAPQGLALLFIDGDHSYAGVKSDWETYKQLLQPGSIVVFHDFGWAEGVQQVITEDVMPYIAKSAQLPNMWWGELR